MLKVSFAALIAIYLAGVASLYIFQRDLLYAFTRVDPDLQDIDLGFMQRVSFATKDGGQALGYYHEAPPNRPTILFLHGNGGELANAAKKLAYYAEHDFGVLGVMYRGSGGTEGDPSEVVLVNDSVAAFDWLVDQGLSPGQIFVMGESLGTGVAVQLAASRPVGAIALGAPYTSVEDVAAARYWFAPVRLLIKDRFHSDQYIRSIKAPLLVVHGEDDRHVPFALGQKLFAAAPEPKQFIALKDRAHGALFDPSVWQLYLDFFNTVASQ